MRENVNHIFVDTNVLIGAFMNIDADKRCLHYLYSLKGKKLYTSSLSVAQLVSVFQKSKQNTEIKDIVKNIIQKFDILGFIEKDIENSLELDTADMEDNIQYVISQKAGCFYFITNNTKDYNKFLTINTLKPFQIRTISQ